MNEMISALCEQLKQFLFWPEKKKDQDYNGSQTHHLCRHFFFTGLLLDEMSIVTFIDTSKT